MHHIHAEKLKLSERQKIWQGILQEFDKSGLSTKAFCERREIKYDAFAYHLTRHRRKQREQQPTFMPVEVRERVGASIHLRWQDMEVDFPSDFDPSSLALIIKALGAHHADAPL